MLGKALNQAAREGSIHLKGAGLTGKQAAELLNLSAAGLKHGASDVLTFQKRLQWLVSVFLKGFMLKIRQ